jgi:hypothetical protein
MSGKNLDYLLIKNHSQDMKNVVLIFLLVLIGFTIFKGRKSFLQDVPMKTLSTQQKVGSGQASSDQTIVTTDSVGNLYAANTLASLTLNNSLNVGNWKIFQNASNQLCFQKAGSAVSDAICLDDKSVLTDNNILVSPKNNLKAWISFKNSSWADTAQNWSLTSITKNF